MKAKVANFTQALAKKNTASRKLYSVQGCGTVMMIKQ